jgi:Ca2+-binding RTX toxin-like protein
VVDEEANTDANDTITTSFAITTAVSGIENYIYTGTTGWTFAADAAANKITGGVAADTLDGDGGNDTLLGNDGGDTLIGGLGNDSLNGGTGADVLKGDAGDDTMTGGQGDDTYFVDSKTDVLIESTGGGIDTVVSTIYFDLGEHAAFENLTLASDATWWIGVGNTVANILTGNDDRNNLVGRDGDDLVIGNGGNDSLAGDNGNDTLRGGAGYDDLTGGAGSDTYDYDLLSDVDVRDIIYGFTKGVGGDVLDLRDLFDDIGYSGTDAVGEGYLSFSYNSSFGTTVKIDADGSLGAGGAKDVIFMWFVELTAADTANYLV